jgi:hypothetical protein
VRNQLQKAMEEGAAPHQYSTWLQAEQERRDASRSAAMPCPAAGAATHALTLSPSQRARRGTRCW